MSSFFLNKEEAPEEEHTNIHVMLDIETMGVRVGAPIITIGAVLFDPTKQDSVDALEKRGFLARIDMSSALDNSEGVDPDTLKWWLQQEDAAIKALVGDDSVPTKEAVAQFRQYCKHRWPKGDDLFFPGHMQYPVACIVWAKSPDFDCKIMEYVCAQVNEQFPFRFYEWRCVRTLQDLAWPGGPDTRPTFKFGTAHDARADAVNQALMVQAGYKELGLSIDTVKYEAI